MSFVGGTSKVCRPELMGIWFFTCWPLFQIQGTQNMPCACRRSFEISNFVGFRDSLKMDSIWFETTMYFPLHSIAMYFGTQLNRGK